MIKQSVLVVESDDEWRGQLVNPLSRYNDLNIVSVKTVLEAAKRLKESPCSVVVTTFEFSRPDNTANNVLDLLAHIINISPSTRIIVVSNESDILQLSFFVNFLISKRDHKIIEIYPLDGILKIEEYVKIVREKVDEYINIINRCDVFIVLSFATGLEEICKNIKTTLREPELDLIGKRADHHYGAHIVLTEIHKYIHKSLFVLADLSGLRPNVYFEVGIAQAISKSVGLIAQNVDEVSPLLRAQRIVPYKNEIGGEMKLQNSLQRMIGDLQRQGYPSVFKRVNFEIDPDLCLALVPHSTEGNQVFQKIISVVTKACRLKTIRSDEINGNPILLENVWETINRARIVIVDLNAFQDLDIYYMAGLAYGLEKKTIYLFKQDQEIPFDFLALNPVCYSLKRIVEIQKTLITRIENTFAEPEFIASDKRQALIRGIRKLLEMLDDSQLESFCIDYYQNIHRRFGRGWGPDEKINLILDLCSRQVAALDQLLTNVRDKLAQYGYPVSDPTDD